MTLLELKRYVMIFIIRKNGVKGKLVKVCNIFTCDGINMQCKICYRLILSLKKGILLVSLSLQPIRFTSIFLFS